MSSRPASGIQRQAIATGFRDPGHVPRPPDRVRARPVLHLEEPAATLAVLTVVFVLVLLLVITRIVQRWLEIELLSHTRIEPSLQDVNAQLAAPNRR